MFDFLDPDNGFVSNQRQLAGMMQIPQRFEKTDPRDSIFAILGLLDRNVCSEGDDRAALLKVDYTKTLADVLRDATRYSVTAKWRRISPYSGVFSRAKTSKYLYK
jgi:hypothetical protein